MPKPNHNRLVYTLCCCPTPEHARTGRLSVRLDTHGGRYVEGLDPAKSYGVLEHYQPQATRAYRNDQELQWLIGTGVSAAARQKDSVYQWVASRILQHIVAALAKDYGHYLRAAPRFEVCETQRSRETINQRFPSCPTSTWKDAR